RQGPVLPAHHAAARIHLHSAWPAAMTEALRGGGGRVPHGAYQLTTRMPGSTSTRHGLRP
ncbi:MAG: hypothetical protein KGI56_01785, partial [Acidobacteriota bacterium]|nr:hypothetical protein [Acidobacteriota bacterium]